MVLICACSVASMAQINIKIDTASCNGKKDGKIDIEVNLNNGPYSFLWQDGSTEDHLYNIGKGTYKVVITDADGCNLEKTIEMGVKDDKPKVKIKGGGEKTFCSDEDEKNVTLTAQASECVGCNYLWSTGASIRTIEVSSDDEYIVTATDEDQCFDKDTTEVEIKTKNCDDDDNDNDNDNDEVDIPVIRSKDPNDMLGPEGVGKQKWVSVNEELDYTIRFENDPDFATAPAQKVVVTSPLSPHLDIYSLRLSSFGFGDFVFEAPENTTFYSTRLDVSDSLEVLVDFIAGIDVVKREAFWIFESVDPETNLEPEAHLGFLLVNDTVTHRGEGFVSFSIKPDKNAETGDSIKAIADIIFDINGSILTPEIFNTIDALAPTSKHRMVEGSKDSVFVYAVSAVDDFGDGGCGVWLYDLYISTDDGFTYNLFAADIPVDSTVRIVGDPDKKYCVYTVAKDSVGNAEIKSSRDICFTPDVKPFVQITGPDSTKAGYCQGEYYVLNWIYSGIDSVNIYLSSDSGVSFKPFEVKVPARHQEFEWKIPLEETVVGENYVFKIADAASDTLFDMTSVFEVKQHVPVEILASSTEFCEGDSSVLSLTTTYDSYTWSTGEKSHEIVARESDIYKVTIVNSNNCSSADSVEVLNHGKPEKPVISAGGAMFEVCPAKGLVLSAPLNFDLYKWSNDLETASITIHDPGTYAVLVSDAFGCSSLSDTVEIKQAPDSVCQKVSIVDVPGLTAFKMEAYPNPFEKYTNLRIALPKADYVQISLHHIKGYKVSDIFEGSIESGKIYEIPLAANDLKAGVYICKLLLESGETQSIKLVIL